MPRPPGSVPTVADFRERGLAWVERRCADADPVLRARCQRCPAPWRDHHPEPQADGSSGSRPRGPGRPPPALRATYREFWDQVNAASRGLLSRGVRKSDRVGIWAPNRYEWVLI